MTYGPFPTFSAMLADAVERREYVDRAVKDAAVAVQVAAADLDKDIDFADVLAAECGMVISVAAIAECRRWSYALTEDSDDEPS